MLLAGSVGSAQVPQTYSRYMAIHADAQGGRIHPEQESAARGPGPVERPTQARDVAQGAVTGERECQLGCAGVAVCVAPVETLAHGAGDRVLVQQRVIDDTGPGLAQRQAADDALELLWSEAGVVTHRRLRPGR